MNRCEEFDEENVVTFSWGFHLFVRDFPHNKLIV